MISKILSTAIKLYLRSQVSQVQDLQVKIVGKNKQILQGYIPQVFLSCDRAVYQGLHLSQIELKGKDIAVNLPEVIKRKPLKLLESIFVEIELKLDTADLQASLDSDLLQSGLHDLWQMILSAQTDQTDHSASELNNLAIEWHDIAICEQVLNLSGTYQNSAKGREKLQISTALSLVDAHTLSLSDLNITNESSLANANEVQKGLKIDLGTDVAIAELVIQSEQIVCGGKIKINN